MAFFSILRGYLSGEESRRFFEYIVQRPYGIDDEILETTVSWLATIPSKHSGERVETIHALRTSLAIVAEDRSRKAPEFVEEAVIRMMLALGFWVLSDENDELATTSFWEGLKLLFEIGASEPRAPLARAFAILEPSLSRVRGALLQSAIRSRRTDSDPFVRASFAIFQAFGGGEVVN